MLNEMKHLAIEQELTRESYISLLCQILRCAQNDRKVILLEAINKICSVLKIYPS